MEVMHSSKMLGFLRPIQHYNPEDYTFHSHSCGKLWPSLLCSLNIAVYSSVRDTIFLTSGFLNVFNNWLCGLASLLQLVLQNHCKPAGCLGHAIAQAISHWLPTAAVRGLSPGLVMWDFVVDKVALGQVYSEYFGFPRQSSFHQLLQKSSSSIIWGLYNRPKRPQYQGLE
jgi:hypothetical protein